MNARSISRVDASIFGVLVFAIGTATPSFIRAIKSRLFPGGMFSKINSSVAGPRQEKALPVGDHELQLYSMGTPNGQKVTCALEEMGLSYDAWYIDISKGNQFWSGFVDINPNSKIPAMVDKKGPNGKPINLFESGSILLYLAEKSKKLIPLDPALRVECLNWVFFQVGAAPYFGQFGHFTRYAPIKIEYAVNRYAMETKRLLDVLNRHLNGKKFIIGDELTIADLAWMPWVLCLSKNYKADDALQLDSYVEVNRWKKALLSRPAIAKGMKINSFFDEEVGFREYHSPK